MVILIGTWRVKKKRATLDEAEGATANVVNLRKAQSVDIAYLAVASLYGMTLFLKDTLTLIDAAILAGIYTLYLVRLSRSLKGRGALGRSQRLHRFPA